MNEDLEPVTGFAEAMFSYHRAESNFTDALCEAEFGEFNRISGDHYDGSLEIYEVEPDARLNDAAQRVIFDAGFLKVYVNHKDGWETHYSWDHSKPFKAARGWRRRYVKDPTATTTNQIGADEPEHRGYWEISYWPESWIGKLTGGWLNNGYMRVVPDPLDPVVSASKPVSPAHKDAP
jgi:hypothetical protein